MSFRFGRMSLYFGKIERGDNGENPPWRGYCWGSDWPTANFQRGETCYCLDISWLCYFMSIYWNKTVRLLVSDDRPSANAGDV